MSDPRFIRFKDKLPQVGDDVFVADTARVIGDVVLGDACSIWYGAVMRGDVFYIRVGDRVNIQDCAVIHVTTDRFATVIESDVTVGHHATLHGCTVRRGALIGMGAVVLDQADVGEGAMVAAGALVTPGTRVEPGTLYGGVPARLMRPLTAEEQKHIAWSASHYCDLAATYMTGEGKLSS